MTKYIKTPRRIWYIYKNGFNIGASKDQISAREHIKHAAELAQTPQGIEVTDDHILWKEQLTGDIYEAKLEDMKR